MSDGLVCPLCGSWYNDDPKLGLWWDAGDICQNAGETGPNPLKCSPEHPCQGRLVLADNAFLKGT